MAVQDYGAPRARRWISLMPKRLRDLLIHCCFICVGAVFAGFGLILLLSLLSYSAGDPSLNTATDGPVANWMGAPGAYTADLLVQILGLTALLIALPLMTWGASMMWRGRWTASAKETRGRIALWALALSCGSLALACLPTPKIWPLTVGLGGLAGDSFFLPFKLLSSGPPGGQVKFIIACLAAAIALPALAGAVVPKAKARTALIDRIGLWLFVGRETVQKWLRWPGHKTSGGASGDDPFTRKKPSLFAWTAFLLKLGRKSLKTNGERQDPILDQRRMPAPDIERAGAIDHDDDSQISGLPLPPKVVRSQKKPRPGKREVEEAQPTLELEPLDDYQLPALSLLAKPPSKTARAEISDDALQQNARLLESVLQDFGVRGEIIRVRPGPVVTMYELEPAAGIKSSRVIGLADDIARSMSAVSARVAVVPGRNVIGIELPNLSRETVFLRELLSAPEYENVSGALTLALGKNISGDAVMLDLATSPHLLIAGTTGSGKSVAVNAMILSLLYRMPPNQCKLILIDPKMLELSVYDGIPHLLTPVVTEPKQAVVALKWVVREMEDRYRKMSKVGVRNVKGYNSRVAEALEAGETLTRTVQTGFDSETGQPIYEEETLPLEPMPYIVVVVDEMADLMMVAGKDIEAAVQRLAQMARAAGIHLITATQRPSVDVITGTIKANFPTRISFQVTSKIDSRTILGEQGADQLLGQGDMLYMAGGGRIRRVHGPFVSDEEVEKVVRFLKKQGTPEYLEDVLVDPEGDEDISGLAGRAGQGEGDELYDEALQIVARDGKASTSYIQRRLQIGYNRAARIIERMEDEGIVSPPNHSGKREVLIGEHAHR